MTRDTIKTPVLEALQLALTALNTAPCFRAGDTDSYAIARQIETVLRTQRIARLNDLCRTAPGLGCRWIQTGGICALPEQEQSAIREKVERFNDFKADNDPYGEHDFGAFEHNGQRIFWKIDAYAPDMQHGSENPADPRHTVRVLTIMLAEEY